MLQSGVDYFEAEVGVLGHSDVGASHHHGGRAGGEGEGAAVRRREMSVLEFYRSRLSRSGKLGEGYAARDNGHVRGDRSVIGISSHAGKNTLSSL